MIYCHFASFVHTEAGSLLNLGVAIHPSSSSLSAHSTLHHQRCRKSLTNNQSPSRYREGPLTSLSPLLDPNFQHLNPRYHNTPQHAITSPSHPYSPVTESPLTNAHTSARVMQSGTPSVASRVGVWISCGILIDAKAAVDWSEMRIGC